MSWRRAVRVNGRAQRALHTNRAKSGAIRPAAPAASNTLPGRAA